MTAQNKNAPAAGDTAVITREPSDSVLLVVGHCSAWFAPGQTYRETSSGLYLQVKTPETLLALAEQLATVRPALRPGE